MKHDPINNDSAYRDRIKTAEKEAENEMKRLNLVKKSQRDVYRNVFWG
jgi:hypothetical protein